MATMNNGLRRGKVLDMFNAKRDSLRRSYPATASASAAPAQPTPVEPSYGPPAMQLRRMSPSLLKR